MDNVPVIAKIIGLLISFLTSPGYLQVFINNTG